MVLSSAATCSFSAASVVAGRIEQTSMAISTRSLCDRSMIRPVNWKRTFSPTADHGSRLHQKISGPAGTGRPLPAYAAIKRRHLMWDKQIIELRDKAVQARLEAQRAEAQRYIELLKQAEQYDGEADLLERVRSSY